MLVGRNPGGISVHWPLRPTSPSSGVQTTHLRGLEHQRVPVGGQTFRNGGHVVTRPDVAAEQVHLQEVVALAAGEDPGQGLPGDRVEPPFDRLAGRRERAGDDYVYLRLPGSRIGGPVGSDPERGRWEESVGTDHPVHVQLRMPPAVDLDVDRDRRKHGREGAGGQDHVAKQRPPIRCAAGRDRPEVPDDLSLAVQVGGRDVQPAALPVFCCDPVQELGCHLGGDPVAQRGRVGQRIGPQDAGQRPEPKDLMITGRQCR